VNSTGIALVHANEAIVPANIAQPFAPGGGAGSGGDVHVHFNITAMDGASVLRTVNQHADVFASVITKHMNSNPSKFAR
jgi:hypothetical protein